MQVKKCIHNISRSMRANEEEGQKCSAQILPTTKTNFSMAKQGMRFQSESVSSEDSGNTICADVLRKSS